VTTNMTTTTSNDPTPPALATPAGAVTTTEADPLAAPSTAPVSDAPAPTEVPAPAASPAAAPVKSETELKEAEPTPLTKKFTEAEWKALRDFRAILPDTFAQAYPDDPEAKNKSIHLWGVDIDPHHPEKDARVSVILMKFLRARCALLFYTWSLWRS
jgi:phosphatidylinositol transfer protein SFH5